MNLALRPATLSTLDRFRSRRASLLRWRALFAALAVLLGALVLIALLDRAWFMPEAVRPWLSVAVYLAAAITAWRVALRLISQSRDAMGAAALVETAEPSLRERLLAAVELSETGDTDRIPDSPEFRARLQDDVAAVAGSVDIKRALPAASLGKWALGLAGVAVLAGLLSLIPMLHLPGFLARAALPFANLERPSSVKIQIAKPASRDAKAPIASEMEIAADILGPRPERVIMETADAHSKTRRIELTNSHDNRYEGFVAIGQTDVRYRLRAGDAITPWYTLTARPRPRVIEFTKTITPPAYTGQQQMSRKEDHGDIEALEGSTLKLTLKTNQPISVSEVLLNPDQPAHPTAPVVKKIAPDVIETEFALAPAIHTWQIALKSEETGFTNEESSPWIITKLPDLPPVAQITEPQEQAEMLPDEAVRLSGLATDDIGLASVKLAHAVNGADWNEAELASKPGKESALQHLFPLAPLGVKAGDAVLLKWVAIDLKGQRAESPPLRVIILEQTIDPKQRQWAEDQRRLAQQAENLAEKTRDMRKSMEKVQKNARLEKQNKDANAPENALAKAQADLEQVKEQADDLWKALKEATRNAPNHLDANEAQMLGERLAALRQDSIRQMEKLSGEPVENPEQLRREASQAQNHADTLAQAARSFAAEDTARIAAQSAQQLHRQENLLTENALQANRDEKEQRPKWQEQQRAAIAATSRAQEDVQALEELTENGGIRKSLEQMRQQVSEASRDLNESLDKPEQKKRPEELYTVADNLRQRLARTADMARGALDEATQRADRARQNLMNTENPALTAIEEAKAALHEAKNAVENPKQKPRQSKDGLTPEERAQKELANAAKQLQDQAEMREQNPLTNDQQALDMNRASRAADKLAQQSEDAAKQKTPEALEKARAAAQQLSEVARTLDADALAQNAMKALDEAAAADPITQKTDPSTQAAQAKAAEDQLKALPQALKRANAPQELANTAQQAADAARNAAEHLKNVARQAATQPPSQQQPVNQQPTADAQAKAAQVAAQIAPKAEEARQALATLTPQISEMMKSVAQDLKETQQETQTAANDAKASKPVEEVADKAQALQPEAAANAEKMDSLQAALRQEANAANLANADQRQMARTADVALAQMQQKTPQIAQNLKQAAQATQSQPQAQALQSAANAQQQTSDALEQLAQAFQNMEQGKALSADELAAAQKMEQDLNVQEPLDEAYKRAQELAQMAKDAANDPAKVLQALEKELPQNPSMQKALAEMAKSTAQSTEKAVAEKANQPAMLGLATELAAHDLARVARHQQRLDQKDAAQQITQASGQLKQTAAQTKSDPSKATQQSAQQAQANAAQAAKAAEQTAANAAPPVTTNPFQQAQGAMLAAALDKLDQTLNPMQSAQSSGQQKESSQQSAQQNLSQAQENQQQSMADQRNQGQTPGSQQPSSQMAQNNQPPKSDNPQASQEGGNFQTTLQDGVLAQEVIMANGDWGHLPTRMAKDLTEATRQEAAPEYRAAIESYYKAIATKAKK